MIPLAEWELEDDGQRRRIELYWGDLSYLEPEHAVDILVVSAFRNDYVPTPGSLIGALDRNGISVYRLSFAKARDLRDEFACWLSQPVGVKSFKRLLCIESGWRGSPPELADNLFRAIAPMSMSNVEAKTVAMPLIGTGDQGHPADKMMDAILPAAIGWIRRGIQVEVLKIVAYSREDADVAKERFLEIKQRDVRPALQSADYDVFLSYSSVDQHAVDRIHQSIGDTRPDLKIFQDRVVLKPGDSWLMQIAGALDSARCVLALYSPDYWASKICLDELSAAYMRHTSSEESILFPVFYRETAIPSFFQALNYSDCREADMEKLETSCNAICKRLKPG